MLKLSVSALLLTLAALASSPLSASDKTTNTSPDSASLRFERCALPGNGGATRAEAQCATFTRPLDPSTANGPTIDLRIARIRSLAPNPAADAFTVINGGPGGSSLTLYADLAPVFTGILRERDIIVIDQRGTGASTQLTCPDLEESPTEDDPEIIAEFAKRCVQGLSVDPRFFTTSVAVTDLDALRATLGYKQLTIYGVSYGTRVAQHYARQYPTHTRALIIDGVLPPTMALGPQVSTNAQVILDSIFARCKASSACNQAFPDLPEEFARLRNELRSSTKTIELANPVTGTTETMELGYGHLAIAVRILSYGPETASIIPVLIHQAARPAIDRAR